MRNNYVGYIISFIFVIAFTIYVIWLDTLPARRKRKIDSIHKKIREINQNKQYW